MFTWICPQCGREVPPSYNECPDCTSRKEVREPERERQPAPITGAAGAPKPLPRPKVKKGLPGWALTLIFALAFGVLGAGGYYAYRHFSSGEETAKGPIEFEAPTTASAAPEKPSILGKYIEVTGLRLTEDSNQKASVRFLVVNHSGAQIADLAGTVALKPSTAESDDPPMGTFTFQVPSLGPYESRDLDAPVQTKLRAYELPDWQYLRAEVKITSP